MRFVRAAAAVVVLGAGVVSLTPGTPQAQTGSCTGNQVVQVAPYTCTHSRVIAGITFTATLNVDASGRATIDYVMDPVQQADVDISVHNYTGINQPPFQDINGTIPAGQTTAQLVIDEIDCGQIDMKAVDLTPGDNRGLIAGPVVEFGVDCQPAPTTTTTTTTVVPSSISPSSISPSSISPSSVSPTLPATGGNTAVPWMRGVAALAAGLVLIVLASRRRAGNEPAG